MAGYLQTLGAAIMGRTPPRVSPFTEAGVSGTPVFGGYVENIERDPRLSGQERYRTAADMLANVSIVAAGLRFFLNLVASPAWTFEAAADLPDGKSSDAAKRAAEFAESVFDETNSSWRRIVRRTGSYRFHGFGIQEWTAKRRTDGLIGLDDIESRPQHTIEQWMRDQHGTVTGVWQRNPENGEMLWLPRGKFMYLVDDSLSDSPEGLGLFRHLVDPASRIRKYLRLEGIGYERDLRGIPIGRAPLAELNAAVKAGTIKDSDRTRMLEGLRKFLRMEAKSEDTSLLLDSTPYSGTTADGTTVSTQHKWLVELLSSQGSGFDALNTAIERVTRDMALILGVEGLLLGGTGAGGNRALSEDKSRNLYLTVNAAVADIAEARDRDVLSAVWKLNGFPEELMPTSKPEDVAFKDAASVAATLRDMATAGAVLAPDDPAIDDVRDLLGISHQPEEAIDRALEMEELGREGAEAALKEPAKPKPGEETA